MRKAKSMNANPSEVLSIVLGGGRGERLFPLTKMRSKPAVPLASKYRIVDIPLSNCINSGLRKIYVLTMFNSASLNRHIPQTYRFDRFTQGFVSILAAEQTPENPNWFQGTADAVRQNIRHFVEMDISLVLILSGDQLYQMDYRPLLKYHLENRADITVSTIPVTPEQAPAFGIMKVDESGRIVHFHEKPSPEQLSGLDSLIPDDSHAEQFPNGRAYLASMGIYMFGRDLLIKILERHTQHDFGQHIIPDSIHQYKVMSYPFYDYWTDIGTIRSFYEANLDLTATIPKFNFYNAQFPIYTRARRLPGSKVQNCNLHQCILAEGSFLSGANIRHSLVGIRSRIGQETTIENTYIMGADYYETLEEIRENNRAGRPNVGIGNHTVIVDAIIDKNARIGHDVRITNSNGLVNFDADNYSVRDKIVVIPKGAVIPDGTVI
jgi:glucose-1-phosphate adenylyltransferase